MRHAALTAHAMFTAALARQETRGWHRRLDFPQRDDIRWRRWTLAQPTLRPGGLGWTLTTLEYEDQKVFQPCPLGGEAP